MCDGQIPASGDVGVETHADSRDAIWRDPIGTAGRVVADCPVDTLRTAAHGSEERILGDAEAKLAVAVGILRDSRTTNGAVQASPTMSQLRQVASWRSSEILEQPRGEFRDTLGSVDAVSWRDGIAGVVEMRFHLGSEAARTVSDGTRS